MMDTVNASTLSFKKLEERTDSANLRQELQVSKIKKSITKNPSSFKICHFQPAPMVSNNACDKIDGLMFANVSKRIQKVMAKKAAHNAGPKNLLNKLAGLKLEE